MTVRKRVRAHGRVQGVFFRDSVRRAAERAGVAGWAANRGDGTVEAVFEGDADAVERMVALCRDGPGHAQRRAARRGRRGARGPDGLRRRLSAGGRPHPFRRAPGVR